MFRQYGAGKVVYVPVTIKSISNNSNPEVVALVKSCTGFFFSGGDQARIITSFYNNNVQSPVMAAIHDTFWNNGGVVSGSSAGTACQSKSVMITGGESYEGLLHGAKTRSSNEDDLTYDPNGGIQFFARGVLDTHFGHRGRQGRLIRLLWDTQHNELGAKIGWGVDQNSAMLVSDVGLDSEYATAIGQYGFTYCSVADAKDISKRYWGISNVRCSYITHADRISTVTGEMTPASYMKSLKGREHFDKAIRSEDLFNSPNNPHYEDTPDREFIVVATRLFDSRESNTYGLSYEAHPTFRVVMTKDDQSIGWDGMDPTRHQYYISYSMLRLDIFADEDHVDVLTLRGNTTQVDVNVMAKIL